MSEEIKEIIYDIKDSLNETPKNMYKYNKITLNLNEFEEILNYIEQLENIRKEAIKATKYVKQFVYDELVDRNVSGATETHCKIMDLLNILNKGDNNGKQYI